MREIIMLHKEKPIIKIKPTTFDKILEAISLLLLIIGLLVACYSWSRIHIIFLAGISVTMYILLTVLARFPEKINYAVKITPENAEIQYFLGIRFIRFIKLWVLLIFDYIKLMTIFIYLRKGINLVSFMGIYFFILVIGFSYYLHLVHKNK